MSQQVFIVEFDLIQHGTIKKSMQAKVYADNAVAAWQKVEAKAKLNKYKIYRRSVELSTN